MLCTQYALNSCVSSIILNYYMNFNLYRVMNALNGVTNVKPPVWAVAAVSCSQQAWYTGVKKISTTHGRGSRVPLKGPWWGPEATPWWGSRGKNLLQAPGLLYKGVIRGQRTNTPPFSFEKYEFRFKSGKYQARVM